MKLLDVKALSAAFVLSGLMTTSSYGNAEGNTKTFVSGDLVVPGEDAYSSAASPGKGGVLVCEDYNQDGMITFDECTFTEN